MCRSSCSLQLVHPDQGWIINYCHLHTPRQINRNRTLLPATAFDKYNDWDANPCHKLTSEIRCEPCRPSAELPGFGKCATTPDVDHLLDCCPQAKFEISDDAECQTYIGATSIPCSYSVLQENIWVQICCFSPLVEARLYEPSGTLYSYLLNRYPGYS